MVGKAVMLNAELKQQMAPEQYGSQKEKSVGMQCLNKRLLYDYARSTHNLLVVCSNDWGLQNQVCKVWSPLSMPCNIMSSHCMAIQPNHKDVNNGMLQSQGLAKEMVLDRKFGQQ